MLLPKDLGRGWVTDPRKAAPRTLFAVVASGREWKISEGSLVFPVGMVVSVQDRDLAYNWIIHWARSLKAYRCWRNRTLVGSRADLEQLIPRYILLILRPGWS